MLPLRLEEVEDEEIILRRTFATRAKITFKKYRWLLVVFCFIIFAVALSVAVNSHLNELDLISVEAAHAAIATENELCSIMGKHILEEGGNAVDAAVAACLCIGIVNSYSSGIGGGGFMLLYQSSTKASSLIDFREQAGENIMEGLGKGKDVIDDLKAGAWVGIPGELRGLELAHQKYGVLDWKVVLQPVIQLARDGFPASKFLISRLNQIEDIILSNPDWSQIYAPQGSLVKVGDLVQRTVLADTLQKIAEEGANAFYEGEIAQTLVTEINEAGGNVTLNDFANYRAIERETISSFYHGYKVITGGPPTSGPVVLQTLNILERCRIHDQGVATDTYQEMIEAFKFGFAQRTYLGDPDFVNVSSDVSKMLSKDWAGEIRKNISLHNTHLPIYYGGSFEIKPTAGTTHISILDKSGFAVSLTSTINLAWGSKILSTTGVLLNNQLDDFSIPGVVNSFGLRPSPANFIAPGKRPLSSSTPTIVLRDDDVELVIGASGGTKIITATIQGIIGVLDFRKKLIDVISMPRAHHQLIPNEVQLEHSFSTTIRKELQHIGHHIQILDSGITFSSVQMIQNSTDGTIYAISDYRKDGVAAGY